MITRTSDEYTKLMLEDINAYGSFVITGVKGDYGGGIIRYYKLGVYIYAPLELRMKRVKQRSLYKFGKRVQPGGDMYEQESRFFEFVEKRDISVVDRWAESLTCPVIHVDGTRDIRENVQYIVGYYSELN
jgi:uridine kinase